MSKHDGIDCFSKTTENSAGHPSLQTYQWVILSREKDVFQQTNFMQRNSLHKLEETEIEIKR